jgi:hypothetical protein
MLFGVIITGAGIFFLTGVIVTVLWTAWGILWPLALILPGLAILSNWARSWRTRPTPEN